MPKGKKKLKRPDKPNDSVTETDYKNIYDETAEKIDDDNESVTIDSDDNNDDWEETDDIDIEKDINDEDEDDDDECAYDVTRRTKNIKRILDNIDNEEEEEEDDDDNDYNLDIYVLPENRRSNKNITKYEKVRLLGERTTQLSCGAKPMLNGVEGLDPRVVAQLEFESKMLPIKIVRPLPNGKKEVWSIKEMNIKKEHIIYGFTGGIVDKNEITQKTKENQEGGGISGNNRKLGINNMIMKENGKKKYVLKKKK